MTLTTAEYRKQALKLLNEYLAGKTSREVAWRWAEQVMMLKEKEWGQLPTDLQDTIHGIWLLHDAEGSWVPDAEELRKIRDDLAKETLPVEQSDGMA